MYIVYVYSIYESPQTNNHYILYIVNVYVYVYVYVHSIKQQSLYTIYSIQEHNTNNHHTLYKHKQHLTKPYSKPYSK